MQKRISSLHEILLKADIEEHQKEFEKMFTRLFSFHPNFDDFYSKSKEQEKIRLQISEFSLKSLAEASIKDILKKEEFDKSTPDLFLFYDEFPVVAIELEVFLQSKSQLHQLRRFFGGTCKLLVDLTSEDEYITKIGYLQYFRTICFTFDISNKMKSFFPYSSGEKSPLIIFPIVKLWSVTRESVFFKLV